jgi:hypothetical protein
MMKPSGPDCSPSAVQKSEKSEMKSHASRLYKDALQSVLMFLEPIELAACMMVSKSWMDTAKLPRVWTGKVLQVAEHAMPSTCEYYTAPWATLALRYVDAIAVFATQPTGVFGNSVFSTNCYRQLLNALRLNALPNLRRVRMLNNTASTLAMNLAGNPYLEEVVVEDNVGGLINDRYSLLQNLPNLRVARVATFNELGSYYGSFFSEFYQRLAENTSIQHLVVPVGRSSGWELARKLLDLYRIVSRHPSIKTLELQLCCTSPASDIVAIILKYCGSVCGNLELLHIKQLEHQGSYAILNNHNTLIHLAAIKQALLETVLRNHPESKMRVLIELIAGNKTIKRYNMMLQELPQPAADLAKERIQVQLNESRTKNSLLYLVE